MRLGWRKKRRRSRPASAATILITTTPPAPCRSAWRTRRPASGGWWRCGQAPAREQLGDARHQLVAARRLEHDVAVDDAARERQPRRTWWRAARRGARRARARRRRRHGRAARRACPARPRRPPSRMAMRWQRSASSGWCVVTMTLGAARRRQRRDLVPDPAQRLGIDAAPGLVEQQQRRLVQQDARDLDAPAHAARILRRGLVGALAQRHQRQRLVDARARQRARQTVERGAQPQVLARRSASDPGSAPGTRRPGARGSAVSAATDRPAVERQRPGVRAAAGPASRRNAVVLPAPLGPSRPNSSPGATSKLTPSSACARAEAARQSVDAQAGERRGRRAGAGERGRRRSCDGPVDRQRDEQQRQVDDRIHEQRARPAVLGARGRKPAAAQPMNTAPSSAAASA